MTSDPLCTPGYATMSDLPRPSQRRLEFQARKIEQLELVIASQSDLISLLRSQLHIHSESTLLLQRRFGDACTRSSATSALAATVATANATPSPPYPVTTPADAEPPSSTYPPTPLRSSRSSGSCCAHQATLAEVVDSSTTRCRHATLLHAGSAGLGSRGTRKQHCLFHK